MLKLMPPTINFNTQPKTKCGEIFCHNTTEFTVYCTFCEMKSFNFEDFLWHLKTLHFAADVCKTENDNFEEVSTKIETEEDKIYDSLIKSYDEGNDNLDFKDSEDDKDFGDNDVNGDDAFCDNESYDEEEPLAILKKKQIKRRSKRKKTQEVKETKSDNSDEEFQDFDTDEEFKPSVSTCTKHSSNKFKIKLCFCLLDY